MATAHMAVRTETFPRSTSISHGESMGARVIPIPTPTIKMSPPSTGDPMEITSPAPSSANQNSDSDANGKSNDRPKNSPAPESNNVSNNSNSMPAPPPAAAAVHQPKIVQTAFIHKLYK